MEKDYIEILDKLEEFVQEQAKNASNEFRKNKDDTYRKENIRKKLSAIKGEIDKQVEQLFPEQIKQKESD